MVDLNIDRDTGMLTRFSFREQAYPGVCLVDKQCYGGQSHGMVR